MGKVDEMVSSPFLSGVGCATMEECIHHRPKGEKTMSEITTIGLDLAKSVSSSKSLADGG
jgi:hypothetical protein